MVLAALAWMRPRAVLRLRIVASETLLRWHWQLVACGVPKLSLADFWHPTGELRVWRSELMSWLRSRAEDVA